MKYRLIEKANNGLPLPLVEAIRNDSVGDADSVTSLIQSSHIADRGDMIKDNWILMGQDIHAALERATGN
jgi:hypothetical protein